jgi:protein-arginine kinase activator protein McsA
MTTRVKDTKTFIIKADALHNNKYDYSKVEYINNRIPVILICKKCKTIFNPTPSNHLLGSGCPNCAKSYNISRKLTNIKFIAMAERIHGNLYDYSFVNYIDAKHKIKIICKKCNKEFEQLPRSHIYGKSGCPYCKISHGERQILMLLKSLDIVYKQQHRFNNCRGKIKPLPFDFYLPKYNLCIEYDGKQHSDKESLYFNEEIIKNDNIKTEFCKNNNITLIRISYKDFLDLDKIIIDWLKSL